MEPASPDPGEQPWSIRLRAAGLRVTQPRLAVLAVVSSAPHLSADQITAGVRSAIGAVSTQAIYDALNTLTEQGILRRFEPAGSSMRFEVSVGDNHHHLVCRSCGSVRDVPCALGSMPCAIPQETEGFVVDEAEVTYWGLCADCVSASTTD